MKIDQTLTGFKSYIDSQGGLPHVNRYAVEMTKPLSMASNPEYTKVLDNLKFTARIASLPSKTISTNAVMAAGPEQKYPYTDVYDNLSVTFLVTKGKGDFGLPERKFFEDWMGTVVNESNMLVGFSTGANAYGVDLFLSGLSDVRGKTSRYIQYKFDRTYPIALGEIKFAHDSHDTMIFTVTFSYDRFVRTENIEDNQPNPKSVLPPEKPKKAEDAERKPKEFAKKKDAPLADRKPKEFAKKKDAPLADREPKEGWDNFKKTEPEKFGPPSPKDIRIVGSQAPSVPTPKKFTQKLKTRATNLVKAKLGIRPMLDE
ncbi:hypothetical protein CMI47_13910 [Candidatus Pacearchaeota archaeon]|nr:hypothetical protein [Candidatus Pacearchaeota archaeon]